MGSPRIAILGLQLESNAFSAMTTEREFLSRFLLRGHDILNEVGNQAPFLCKEISAFMREMQALTAWEPVPLLAAGALPKGPLDHALFQTLRDEILTAISEAYPVDAVFLANHGAMTTSEDEDPDGDLLAALRSVVGPATPIAVTLDLHANVSVKMFRNADLIVGYRTNPHVDQAAVGEIAARWLHERDFTGNCPKAMARLPIFAPPTRLLTDPKQTFGHLMSRVTSAESPLCASLFGGFAFSDVSEGGLSVLAYGPDQRRCSDFCLNLAEEAWSRRAGFRAELVSVESAMEAANQARIGQTRPVCLADVADNPGGGATGATTVILSGLLQTGISSALVGLYVAPELAERCHERRIHGQVPVRITDGCLRGIVDRGDVSDETFDARVLAVSSGRVVGRRGLYESQTVDLGLTAAIDIRGVVTVVVSNRVQCCDPCFFEHLGLRIRDFPVVVVKSRGHFRAGFDEFFGPSQILEVDAPGLTSPMLSRFTFKRMLRPSYPLDGDFELGRIEVIES